MIGVENRQAGADAHPESWWPFTALAERVREEAAEGREPTLPSWLRGLVGWTADYIARPHPEMPRKGAICPYVQPSIERNFLFVKSSTLGDDEDGLCEYMLAQATEFLSTAPTPPDPDSVYKSLIIAFPAIPDERAGILTVVRRKIKPAFLRSEITCGEFYNDSNDRSARNKELRIALAPVPCIAVRYLTPHDELFLRTQPDLYPIFKKWRRPRNDP